MLSMSFTKASQNDFIYIFFVLTRIIALVLSSHYASDDIDLYFSYASNIVYGISPYSNFTFEYPPLTILPIYFAEISFGKNDVIFYYLTFSFMMMLLDFCCLALCRTYCKDRLKMSKKEIGYMVLLYSLFGLLSFRILYRRLDIVVALFFTVSLLFFQAKNSKLNLQFFVNGLLGFFYKIVPAFTMPAAIIFKAFTSKTPVKRIISDSLIFVSILATIIWVLQLCTDHQFIPNMLFHEKRGVQIESIFSSVLLFKNLLLQQVSPIIFNYGSVNIEVSDSFLIFAKFFGNFVLLSFYAAIFFVLFFKKNRGEKIKFSEENFLEATLVIILLCLSFQRVLSPQFFVWLIPASTIWLAKNPSVKFLLIFCFLFLATFAVFSINYGSLINEEPFLVTILLLRNLVLIGFTLFLGKRFFKNLAKNDFN